MSNRCIYRNTPRAVYGVLLGALLLVASPVLAQQQASDSSAKCIPKTEESAGAAPANGDANVGANEGCAAQKPQAGQKDDRIFGVMPNFTTVEGAENLPPLTVGQKFKLTAKGAFDPYEFVIVGILAGVNLADDKDNSYGPGAAGYGRRYAAGFADQAIGNFMTGAIYPSILREDPRYYQLGHGTVKHRFVYALSRIVITPRDKGGKEFNFSEFLGNATAAAISASYRDQADRTVANTAETFGDQMLLDCLGNELKEFWPDIHRKVFHRHHKPQEPV